MSQSSIPVRFDPETISFLSAEAARHGVSRSEYIRRLVARGILAQSLEEAVAEIRAISGANSGGITEAGFRVLLETLLEVRALLRIVSARSYPDGPTEARRAAADEVAALLGPIEDETSNVD